MEISRKAVYDEFPRNEMVYLSPYSSTSQFILCCYLLLQLILLLLHCMLSAVLQEVKSSVVYVVGGVVDKVRVKVIFVCSFLQILIISLLEFVGACSKEHGYPNCLSAHYRTPAAHGGRG